MTAEYDKVERQIDAEIASHSPVRHAGWAEGAVADYRRCEAEEALNWIHEDRDLDEAELNYRRNFDGAQQAARVYHSSRRLGVEGNAGLRMREAALFMELLSDPSGHGCVGPTGATGAVGVSGTPCDPIQYLRFIPVTA